MILILAAGTCSWRCTWSRPRSTWGGRQWALFGNGGLDNDLFYAVLFLGPLLDLCGLGALGAGLGAGGLPPALAVGYTVTALGALFIAWMWVVEVGIKGGQKDVLVGGLFGTACILAAFFVPFAVESGWDG